MNPKEGKKEERWMKQKEMAKRKTMALFILGPKLRRTLIIELVTGS